jgi:hypothetical protein
MSNSEQTTRPQPNEELLPKVSWGEAFGFWFKLGFISFGGPAGQIALMHEELVAQLLHGLARARGTAIGHLHRLAAA